MALTEHSGNVGIWKTRLYAKWSRVCYLHFYSSGNHRSLSKPATLGAPGVVLMHSTVKGESDYDWLSVSFCGVKIHGLEFDGTHVILSHL